MALPTPYYERDGVTLYHGDCRDMLAAIDATCVVTDPPFGTTNLVWDQVVEGWTELLRPNCCWVFGSFRSLASLVARDFAGWTIAQDLVWEKHNGANLHADRFRRVHEQAVQFYRGAWGDVWKCPQFTMDATARTVRKKERPAQWLGRTGATSYVSHDGGPRHMRSVIRVRSAHGEALHPTQKPEPLLQPIVSYSCPSGGLVLDPFAGSGSTLVAALSLGRRAVGIEINADYCEIAARRLSQGVLNFTETP